MKIKFLFLVAVMFLGLSLTSNAVELQKQSAQATQVEQTIPVGNDFGQTSEIKQTQVDQVVLVILAIFIPPLAVFLKSGLGTEFWIDLILTILGWFPGTIYALLVVLDIL